MGRLKSNTLPLPGTYDPLPAHLVAELVAIGYSAEAVDSWTTEKARLTLRRHQIQANAAVRRGMETAADIEGIQRTGGPIGVLRLAAVRYISEAIEKNDTGDLLFAVQGGCGELTDDELKRLADHMIRKLGVSA